MYVICIACFRHLEHLLAENPQREVGMVTFENELVALGDGSQMPVTVAGDKLHDYDRMLEEGKAIGKTLKLRPLTDSHR